MISKWYELKPKAVELRKKGTSIREVEKLLKIPRSTLSGWFRNIKLTKTQKRKLDIRWQNALYNARKKAVLWHNYQKELRIRKAQNDAIRILNKIILRDKNVLELALAMIYMGEGSKKNVTSLGNTNPLILKFFIKSLNILYNIDKTEIRCELHLRNDQNAKKIIKYWSKEISIPENRFTATKDKRPIKSKTYPNYMGVCVVRCGKIAIQRKLGFIGEGFCNKIVELDA